jgi:hypothetical protein
MPLTPHALAPPEIFTQHAACSGCVAGALAEDALFSNEVIAPMRELIPTERYGRVAASIVVKAFLPQMQSL